MKDLSLKYKIHIIGFVPFAFYLFSMMFSIQSNYQGYQEATLLKKKLNVIQAASNVVDETQKERGKTAAFLSGGISLEGLKEQRSNNDKEVALLKKELLKSPFSKKYQDEVIFEINKLTSLREKISKNEMALGEALKSYTQIVMRLLKVELDVANKTEFPAVAARLKSFRIIEDAKESGGKLRANMSGVLAKNKAIGEAKFSTIINLKAGVDEGMKSSGLIFDEKTVSLTKKFYTSSEWKEVNRVFNLILKKSEIGNYGVDSSQFFTTITGALNIIGELLSYQKSHLADQVNVIQEDSLHYLWRDSIVIVLLVLGLFFFVSKMTSSITSKIKEVIDSLALSSKEVAVSSEEISVASHKLSESSHEQAASLQETVSSIDEISSMVQRNANTAGESSVSSEKSKNEALNGKRNIDEMIKSINEIAASNEEIMKEMEHNNEQLNKITLVISEIGEKTRVINDIVFQTKLLSFNASVEAARAGEHGKGFSVVAEEVGNLASMSGQAALEISEMLENSIKQVHSIVKTSKEKVESLVAKGKEKISNGTDVAQKCGDSLEAILQNVGAVNEMVKEISTASGEQAAGIGEISSAMQQLDQLTHSNTSASQDSAAMASQLKTSAQSLNESVILLNSIIEGAGNEGKAVAPNDNVVKLPKKKEDSMSMPQTLKKVSGSDITPVEDNEFEDL